MDIPLIRRHEGIRQIGEGLGTLDREVFEAIAESPSPLLDTAMPRLTRAADHSKLWFAIAAALAATRHRASRRGAARGVMTLGVTSLFTNQVAKQAWKRPRPSRVPLARQSRTGPEPSNSLPSGHSASAAASRSASASRTPRWGWDSRYWADWWACREGCHRRALSRRCVRRLRHLRRCYRRAGRTNSAADRTDEDSHRGSASARNPCPSARRGRGSGDQPRFRRRNGGARRRAGS